jgi:hybrid polyketide synthase/nonribosomal peptide synthetase ACE1
MVICVALRKIESRIASGILPAQSQRLTYFAGDLSQPRLGLSESAWAVIASQADVVVHVGADVSHVKRYRTLRDANVGGTTEAARLCLVKGIPLHFLSSAEVAMLGAKPPKSFSEASVRVAEVMPSQDDGRYEGYASSKWVCERLLENLVESGSGLRVWIHRPSIITASSGIEETAALVGQPDAPLLRSLLFYSRVLRAVPSPGSWVVGGTLDFVGMETVVRDLVKAILHEDDDANDSHKGVSYVHHTGDEELAVEDILQSLTQREREDIGHEAAPHLPPFDRLPLTEWAIRAQGAGMHALLATIFENAQEETRSMYFPKFVKSSNRLI